MWPYQQLKTQPMFTDISKDYILFIDIETVSQYADYHLLPEEQKKFWDYKSASLFRNDSEAIPEKTYERAAIYAEFGKIICISSGYIRAGKLNMRSFVHQDERELLLEFSEALSRIESSGTKWALCAHNGKEFDFPYIARRMMIQGVRLPSMLDARGKKPWEISNIDTMELWKFGDMKQFVSLNLLASVFNIPSPKDDIDGSMVGKVYYQDQDIGRIQQYCEKDVLTLCRVYLKLAGEPDIC